MELERSKEENVFEMVCLRGMCGLTSWDRVRNEEVSRRVQVERHLSSEVNQCVLRWLCYVERMDEECMAKVIISDVEGNRSRGRPRLVWMDDVKRALGERGMSVKQGRQNTFDRRWESIVRSK